MSGLKILQAGLQVSMHWWAPLEAKSMKILDIVNKCIELNIKLGYENGRVLIRGESSKLTPELIEEIKKHKNDILEWLRGDESRTSSYFKIMPVERTQFLPLSFVQKRLWFIDRLDGSSPQFNMSTALRVRGKFNLVYAEEALKRIIARHEPLRTVYLEEQGVPFQRVNESFDFSIVRHDLTNVTIGEQESEIKAYIDAEAMHIFDLRSSLMVRVSFIFTKIDGNILEGVLLFTTHHIAADGWAISILVKEFVQQYQSVAQGDKDPLVQLNIRYADYANWQNNLLEGDSIKPQLNYWQEQLSGIPIAHDIPLDRPRPENKKYDGGLIIKSLPKNVMKRVEEVVQILEATPFILMNALLSLVLSRHSNNNDIVIGTPVANRTQKDLEPLIGVFVNYLVLRINTNFSTFSDFLSHVKKVNIEAQSHQELPFDYLVEHAKVARSSQHTPIFQVMFTMNNLEQGELLLSDVNFSSIDDEVGRVANFDLELRVETDADNVNFIWIYDTAIFDADRIENISDHFSNLLSLILEKNDVDLAALNMLSSKERKHLVCDLNLIDKTDYPLSKRVHELFEVQVEKRPESIAAAYDHRQITYSQLNEKANKVAHYLIEHGIRPNVLVGIYAERSIDFLVGILAVMKAGGAYVPLDPNNPKDRLDYMVENAQAPVVLSQKHLKGSLSLPGECTEVFLDLDDTFADYPESNPGVKGSADDLAYMIYTSGSTGRPKGALVHHAGAVNHIYAEFELLDFMANGELIPSNFLQSAASSSDVSVWQFLAPVVSGGKTVVLDDMTNLPKMMKLLIEEQVHLIQTAPVVLQLLIDHLEKLGRELGKEARRLPDLRWLMTIAEATPVALINRWFQLNPLIPIMNGFGPSEASDDITYYIMREPLPEDLKSVPIGRAIPNMYMYVVDKNLQLVPEGSVGELCVSGVGVGPGYWKNEERNAVSFVKNPFSKFSPDVGERLYRTGDLGRWLPSGDLEFIGRIDDQVKIRGFRVELSEIEHYLSECAQVTNAVAIVRKDTSGQNQVVAYVVPESDDLLTSSDWLRELRATLEVNLPSYMLPSAIVPLAEIPLTPADKVDKKALPNPELSFSEQQYEAPANETESKLVGIWAELLNVPEDKLGVTESFFQLGGHSILAVKMMSKIRDQIGCELPIKVIFEQPDIRRLAEFIGREHITKIAPEIVPANDYSGSLPLSFAQKRLWIIDRLEGGSSQYNLPTTLKIVGDFNLSAAEKAFQKIIERHTPLRTVFAEDDNGAPIQIVREDLEFLINIEDLSGLAKGEQQGAIQQYIRSDCGRSFDLTSDLMIRVSYLQLSNTDKERSGIIHINTHHIASDGWSTGVIIGEFIELYRAFDSKTECLLSELPIQYSDYALWQKNWLSGEVMDTELAYWKDQLADLPLEHSLPLDFARPKVKESKGDVIVRRLPPELSQRIIALAKQYNVTVFMLLHAVLGILFSRHGNASETVIGTPVANRTQTALEKLVGFFVNTLVLRTKTQFESFPQYLSHVAQVNVDAQSNQDVPFESLVESLHVPRSLQYTPLFQIIFMMDTTEQVDLTIPGLDISSVLEHSVARFDLNIRAVASPEGLDVSWVYDTSLFKRETVEVFDTHFATLLESVAETPEAPLNQLSMLSNDEVDHLLNQMNYTYVDHPKNVLVHELFEEQVELVPNNTAILSAEEKLSYRELNESANQLAHKLRAEGVNEKSIVGLHLKRSTDMVIAVLAVLKSGGAYVPLDPDHPVGRLNYVIQHTDLKHLITASEAELAFGLSDDVRIIQPDAICFDKNLSKDNLPRLPNQNEDDLAYVIYTSGSTGQPKGVMVNHRTVANFLFFTKREFMLKQIEGAVVSSTLAFDATVGSLYPPLVCGGYIELLRDDKNVLEDLERCLLNTDRSLLFKITPAHINAIARKEFLTVNTSSQHVLVIAGEQLLVRDLYRWKKELLPNSIFINEYGPTEATVGTTTFHGVEELEITPDSSKAVPIGKPLDNARLYILDSQQNILPKGATGELYIGGEGVSVGYLNRPDLTAEKFICKSINGTKTERLYRTGDLVRYLEDGNVEFISRVDHQVKVRGFRIELGEIEHNLSLCPEVQACVAIVREDEPGNKRIVAYIVAKDEALAPGWVANIRSRLEQNLPSYMVPSIIVKLDELPLNTNGKVDKKSLPRPDESILQGDYQAAATDNERILVGLWAKLLKLSVLELSVTANFFELGGDSILSIQLVSRAAKVGLYFTPKDIFEARTIRRLAALAQTSKTVVAEQGDVSGELTLLPIQKKFFEDETDLHHYNQATILTAPDSFDESCLIDMLMKLYQRHDALRLKFQKQDDGWRAKHVDVNEISLEQLVTTIDWNKETFDEIEPFATQAQQSLDPENAKLLKFVYFKPTAFKEMSGRLLLIIHHLVVDGVSWRVLLEDIETLYRQRVSGEKLKLDRKTSSFKQWGRWVEKYAHSDTLLNERDYWSKVTQISPKILTDVNTDNAHRKSEFKVETCEFTLSRDKTTKLLKQCNSAYRTKINELFLAGLLLSINRFKEKTEIRLDLEGHGRELIEKELDVSQTVGWFTSVYPIALSIDNGCELADIICSVKEQYRTVPQSGFGFSLLKYIKNEESLVGGSDSDLVFNYLGQFDQVSDDNSIFSFVNEDTGINVSPCRKPNYPLSLNGLVVDEQLRFQMYFDEIKFSADEVNGFMQSFESALEDVIDHCSNADGRLTPADFPLAKVNAQELQHWQEQYQSIEDLYPATGMQQGLLFHSLLDSGSYISQTTLSLNNLDVSVFKQAWQTVMDRHSIFRTAFVGVDSRNAHQLVLRDAAIQWDEYDLSSFSGIEQDTQLESIRIKDKTKSFEPGRAPLMRMSLVKTGGNEYKFIWSNHHALLDGWCRPRIFVEVVSIYSTLKEGSTIQLVEAPAYRDYIVWLQAQDADVSREFWRKQLEHIEGETPLPLDIGTTDDSQMDYVTDGFSFDADLTEQLVQFARSCKTTVNTIIQASWSLLLSRYSGDSTVVFGATTSGRPPELPGVEDMIGIFINTIPVVVNTDVDLNVSQWLQNLHRAQIERQDHAYIPLVDIQSLSPIKRSLFNSIVVFENYPIEEVLSERRESKVSLNVSDVQSYEETNFGLCLTVYHTDKLSINFQVKRDDQEQDRVKQVIQHFRQLIVKLMDKADKPIRDISMLSTEESERLIADYNRTEVQFPENKCIHELIEDQASLRPNATALVYEEQALSYRELSAKSDQLASYLIMHHNLELGDLVGICMERSFDMVIAILGIMKAGGAYVPMAPELPAARLSYIERDAQMSLVLTQRHLGERLSVLEKPLMCIEESEGYSKPGADLVKNLRNRTLELDSENLAYVIYTSGSTGNPKGVMVEHRAVVNRICWMHKQYACSHQDKILQKTPYNFDVSVWEFIWPLISGATLVIAKPDGHKDPEYISDTVSKNKVTKMHFVPSMLRVMLASGMLSKCTSLEQVFCSGEALSISDVKEFQRQCDWCELHNLYGPTEAAIDVSYWDCKNITSESSSVPIGQAIDNTQLLVLDEYQKPVPNGVAGELYIIGAGLARGYLGREELTQERFVANPYFNENDLSSSPRMYKTGDLVCRNAEGDLEYIGRLDFQVKINGMRIELGEIEYYLANHDLVKSSVVLANETSNRDAKLVAYLVLEQGDGSSEIENILIEYLEQHIPTYMIPRVFISVDEIPLTVNGKVDRKTLIELDRGESITQYLEPNTEEEKMLSGIWEKLLEVEKVGINDDFFQLGGNSLVIIELISKLNKLGFDLLAKDVYVAPTIQILAKRLTPRVHKENYTYDYQEGDPIYTLPNRALLFKYTFGHHWNRSGLVLIENANYEYLNTSMKEVLEGNEGLRHFFDLDPEGHVIEHSRSFVEESPIQRVDLTHLKSEHDVKRFIEDSSDKFQFKIHLTKLTYQFVLFDCGQTFPSRFLWITHSSLMDPYSAGLFLNELSHRYLSRVSGKQCKYFGVKSNIYEWGNYLHNFVNNPKIWRDVEYWMSLRFENRKLLADYPEGIQQNQSDNAELYGNDMYFEKDLSLRASQYLLMDEKFKRRFNVADVLVSSFVSVIAKLTGGSHVYYDLTVNGRAKIVHEVDLSRTIGWFNDYVPTLVESSSLMKPLDRLDYYKKQVSTVPNFGLSFNAIMHLSQDARLRKVFSSFPKAEFSLSYVSSEVVRGNDVDKDLPWQLLSQATEDRGRTHDPRMHPIKWPSYVAIYANGEKIKLQWICRDSIYKRETVQKAIDLWCEEVENLRKAIEQEIV